MFQDRPSAWARTASTLNRWLWGALCCGVPGVPCYFCTCCERLEDVGPERDRPRVNRKCPLAFSKWKKIGVGFCQNKAKTPPRSSLLAACVLEESELLLTNRKGLLFPLGTNKKPIVHRLLKALFRVDCRGFFIIVCKLLSRFSFDHFQEQNSGSRLLLFKS